MNAVFVELRPRSAAATGRITTFVLNSTMSATEASTTLRGEALQFVPAEVQSVAMKTSLDEFAALVNVARSPVVTRKSSTPSPFVSMSMRSGVCTGEVHGPNVATAK